MFILSLMSLRMSYCYRFLNFSTFSIDKRPIVIIWSCWWDVILYLAFSGFTSKPMPLPVVNSPIHRVYRRYTKFRWTQNIDEICFFAKESFKILNVSPTNQLIKCYKDYFCLAAVSSSLAWQSLAILCGECMGLRAHFYTARNSDIYAPIVIPWFFTSKASGECSLKQSSGQAPLNTAVNCRS